MPLTYTFVARHPSTVLAEYTPCHGSINTLALECLQHLQPDQQKLIIACDKHTFNFLRRDEFVFEYWEFLVVADEACDQEIPFAFLERISEDFAANFASKAQTAGAHGMDQTVTPMLKQHMDYYINNPDEIFRVARVQKKVEEVKGVMKQNVEKISGVPECGEHSALLVDEADKPRNHAYTFQEQGQQLRKRMWWENMPCENKLTVMVAVVLVTIATFVLASCASSGECESGSDPSGFY